MIRRHLAVLGITLRAACQPIDDSPTGRAMEGMLSVFSQLDNDMRAAKVKEGMLEAAKHGQWIWRAPLGYIHSVRPEGGRTMIPDPVRGPLVAKAFDLVASGLHTAASALAEVTVLGLRTARGEPLCPESFRHVLENHVYAGRVRVPSWQLDVQGNFPPLVDPDVWWRAQSKLNGGVTATPHLRNRPDFPLRGTVICSVCGRPLTASWSSGRGGKYGYYHCPAPARCKATKIRKEVLEEDFLQLLRTLRPEPEYLALFRAVTLDAWHADQKDIADRRMALEAEVRETRRRRDRLVEAYLYEQAVSEEIYQDQMARIDEAYTLANMRLHDAQVSEIDIEAVIAFAEHLALKADRIWAAGSLEQRQRLQCGLYPNGVKIMENRLVRTLPTLLIFKGLGGFSEEKQRWPAWRDSNPRPAA